MTPGSPSLRHRRRCPGKRSFRLPIRPLQAVSSRLVCARSVSTSKSFPARPREKHSEGGQSPCFAAANILQVFDSSWARIAVNCPRARWKGLKRMAGTTGLEPATSYVTGRRSNQLNYVPAWACNDRQNNSGWVTDASVTTAPRPIKASDICQLDASTAFAGPQRTAPNSSRGSYQEGTWPSSEDGNATGFSRWPAA